MPIKEWLLSWNLQSDMIWIQLYEFCGTITCGMELKSYFSDISGALVSVRTMFLQHLISMHAEPGWFHWKQAFQPSSCHLQDFTGCRSTVILYHLEKSRVQLSYTKSGLWDTNNGAKRWDSKWICCCSAQWGSSRWLHGAIARGGTETEDSSWNMPCRKLFIVN